MRAPTERERNWILDKIRGNLDWATGARYCGCTGGPAAYGQGRNPRHDCPDCRGRGLISNPGWNGNPEHFDQLKPAVVAASPGGTALVEPDDGVGPDKNSASYEVSGWGLRLTRGFRWDESGVSYDDETGMTWNQIRNGLLERESGQLTLGAA